MNYKCLEMKVAQIWSQLVTSATYQQGTRKVPARSPQGYNILILNQSQPIKFKESMAVKVLCCHCNMQFEVIDYETHHGSVHPGKRRMNQLI
jgi:hypothetical protein